MKRMKLLTSIVLIALSTVMSSCKKMDEILHANMLEETKWDCVEKGDFRCSDGKTYAGIKTILFRFETATKGEMTTSIVTSAETLEETVPFDYKFMDSMISGSITIKEGDYSGEYNVAYSPCDESLILYHGESVYLVIYKITD